MNVLNNKKILCTPGEVGWGQFGRLVTHPHKKPSLSWKGKKILAQF